MNKTDILSFDGDIKVIPFKVNRKGVEVHYELREMNGKLRSRFQKFASKNVKRKGGTVEVSEDANTELYLLSLSIYDEKGVQPTVAELEQWPANALSKLSETAMEVNGFTKDPVKNDQGENDAGGSESPENSDDQ